MPEKLDRLAIASAALVALLFTLAVAPAGATSGDLDATWGAGGFVSFSPFAVESLQGRLGLQADGKVVLAAASSFPECSVRRFRSDGTPDPDFGSGGVLVVPLGGQDDDCDAVLVQPDGRILVAGRTTYSATTAITVVRLLEDGSLDPDWAGAGVVEIVIGSGNSTGRALPHRDNDLALDSLGRVTVAAGIDGGIGLARLTSTGVLDPSFGTGGKWVVNAWLATDEALQEMLVRPNGKLVVGVTRDPFGDRRGSILQLNLNGTRDASFGNLGIVDLPIAVLGGIALESDGDVLATGFEVFEEGAGPGGMRTTRLLPSGLVDGSFGIDGVVSTTLRAADVPADVLVQPDGKILVGGGTQFYSGPLNLDLFVLRYLADGSLDPTWGTAGVSFADLTSLDVGSTLALQPDGRVLLAGFRFNGGLGFLARFEGDVGPVPPCGNGVIDPGEDCDDDGLCCGPTCQFDPAGTLCGPQSQCSGFQCDSAGICANAPLPAGSPCSDGSPCTADACQAGSCISVAAPSSTCRQQLAPRGQFALSDPDGENADKLFWRWQKGEATTAEEFAQQDYDLCVYDFSSGAATLVTHLATHGDVCVFDCWKLRGQNKIYVDVFGTHDGLRQIYPKPRGDGEAGVQVQARGENLPMPSLPLTPPVTVQLVSEAGDCWSATYSAPTRNDAEKFQAKPDP